MTDRLTELAELAEIGLKAVTPPARVVERKPNPVKSAPEPKKTTETTEDPLHGLGNIPGGI